MTSVDQLLDAMFDRPEHEGISLAVVVMRGGEVVAERYGTQPATAFEAGGPVTRHTRLISWSVAKSITHAAAGVLVGEGRVSIGAQAAVPAWQGTDKAAITLLDLFEMRPGLRFVEDYVDGDTSHCLDMLFGSGKADHAAYAAGLPLDHAPGTVWNYSSGTTNIICRILGDIVGGGENGMRQFLRRRLFEPAGMASADPRFDDAGTWVGSSYVYATARDFARFGELYRNDGVAHGRQVLPEGWSHHATGLVATDPETGFAYGRHWWMWPDLPGSMAAHGYEGQFVVVVPDRELVVVHLGKTDAAVRPGLVSRLRDLIDLY